MNEPLGLRMKLTPAEREQWERDLKRIRALLGRLPYKAVILMAVHVLAGLIDKIDTGAIAEHIE